MAKDGMDRRTKYTRMVLRESLMELLKEKPIGKISVKEICEGADVNRCTFYAHYSDPYDLLRQIEQEMLDDVNETIAHFSYLEDEPENFQVMCQVFEYIAENSTVCRILLGSNGDIEFQKAVMMIAYRQYVEEWTAQKALDQETVEYLYLFAVNGGIGIIQQWLKSGLNKPVREMAELLTKLANHGTHAFL